MNATTQPMPTTTFRTADCLRAAAGMATVGFWSNSKTGLVHRRATAAARYREVV